MKKIIILGLTAAGLSFGTANALANTDDSKYPAADFQPKVVYIDKDAVKGSQSQSAFDPNYPASSFQPKVVFIDKDLAKQATSSARQKRKVVFDPKFPAAYFEPKVIYP